jgi:hypothetical protein
MVIKTKQSARDLNLRRLDATRLAASCGCGRQPEPGRLFPEMEFPVSHIVFRVLLGSTSFICCWIAIGWFRQTREMKRTGKVRPLTLPLPAFLEIDIANEFAHRMTERSRDRRPPWLQAGMDRVRVASTILNNYLKTLFLALLGLLAIGLVILDLR